MIQVWFKYAIGGAKLRTALVVPCTKSKSQPVPAAMVFGALEKGECESVASAWQTASRQATKLVAARELYSGTGWSHTLRAAHSVEGDCDLWIVSAGFGLVRGEERLPPYSATFAAEENRVGDTVCGFRFPAAAHAAWWKTLNSAWGRTQTPLQTTFAAYDRVIITLSAPYLAAVRADLELLAHSLGPQKLWLVTLGVQTLSPRLRQCLVPMTSEIERLIGGPRATLNLRGLSWWLDELVPLVGWEKEAQDREIRRRLCELGPKPLRVTRTMSDQKVARWIEKKLDRAQGDEGRGLPRGGKTWLLQVLRASGLSCEQSRFGRICDQVVSARRRQTQ